MKETKQAFIQTVWELMDVLHRAQNTADGLSGCLDVLCDTFSCEQGSLWVFGKSKEFLYALAQHGRTNVAGLRLAAGTGVTGQAAASGNTVLTDFSSCKDLFCIEEKEADFPEGSLLWIPLKTPHGVSGCIQLGERKEEPFSEDELADGERYGALIGLDLEENGIDGLQESGLNTLASLKHVVKDYGAGESLTHVLKNVSLDIYENEILVILGESGSGKSSLLNVIGCMTPLTSGQLEVDGQDCSSLSESALTSFRRNSIGFIFQAYNLMPNLTARENVQIISELSSHPMDPEQALELVGLSHRAGHLPSALSGGQQQRVAIARAIAKSPKMILADEPTAALDYETGKEVLTVLQDVVRRRGTTLVIVTHNAEIARIADRVVRLKNGRISSIRVNPSPLQAADLVW